MAVIVVTLVRLVSRRSVWSRFVEVAWMCSKKPVAGQPVDHGVRPSGRQRLSESQISEKRGQFRLS